MHMKKRARYLRTMWFFLLKTFKFKFTFSLQKMIFRNQQTNFTSKNRERKKHRWDEITFAVWPICES